MNEWRSHTARIQLTELEASQLDASTRTFVYYSVSVNESVKT